MWRCPSFLRFAERSREYRVAALCGIGRTCQERGVMLPLAPPMAAHRAEPQSLFGLSRTAP